MMFQTLRAEPPLVWPDTRELTGPASFEAPVLQLLAPVAGTLSGLVTGVDLQGARWLGELLREKPGLQCRLLLGLYPACPTGRRELAALNDLQASSIQVQFRLLIAGLQDSIPSNSLCIAGEEGRTLLVFGAAPNFGLGRGWPGEVNAAFAPDTPLLASWQNWLNLLWHHAPPLRVRETILAPLLQLGGANTTSTRR